MRERYPLSVVILCVEKVGTSAKVVQFVIGLVRLLEGIAIM
jgi:hypothetical protein